MSAEIKVMNTDQPSAKDEGLVSALGPSLELFQGHMTNNRSARARAEPLVYYTSLVPSPQRKVRVW